MKILSLSYFAEIWPHSFPEFAVLKSLNEKYNFKIDYLNCDSYFSSCAVHDSRQESFSNKVIKSNICKFCINTKNSYLKSSNLRSLKINDYIEQKDYKKIDKILKNIDPSNYLKKTVFGITFGKYTLFNYLIGLYEQAPDSEMDLTMKTGYRSLHYAGLHAHVFVAEGGFFFAFFIV